MSNLLVDVFRMSELNSTSVVTLSVCAILGGIYGYKNSYDFNSMINSALRAGFVGSLVGILGRVSHLF